MFVDGFCGCVIVSCVCLFSFVVDLWFGWSVFLYAEAFLNFVDCVYCSYGCLYEIRGVFTFDQSGFKYDSQISKQNKLPIY